MLLGTVRVTIKKEHTCHGCTRLLIKGRSAYSSEVVGTGVYKAYWCGDCYNTWVRLLDVGDDVRYGEFKRRNGGK